MILAAAAYQGALHTLCTLAQSATTSLKRSFLL